MRQFQFQLRLRDGQIVTADAIAERWQWSKAFAEACAQVERRLDLGSWSGIVCVSYESHPLPPLTVIPGPTQDVTLPSAA